MIYQYSVYQVYYPDEWMQLSSYSTLEEALDYKTSLQEKAKESNNTMYDYVVVISDY